MKVKLKKTTVLLICLAMLTGMILPAFAFPDAQVFVTDLTTLSGAGSVGLNASSEYTKSGFFTAKWSGNNLYSNIKIPVTKSDFSEYNFVNVWVYAKARTNSNFAVLFKSDNPNTPCLDYYYKKIQVDFEGWKLLSFDISNEGLNMTKISTPLGFDQITGIELWPNYGGNTMDISTELYFDNFFLSDTGQSSENGSDQPQGTMMIYDFSDPGNSARLGLPSSSEQVRNGSSASTLYSGGNLNKSLNLSGVPTDWSDYSMLHIWIYSEVDNNSNLVLAVKSENPDTEGLDYYKGDISISWTGWNEIKFSLGTPSTLQKNRTPLGFNQITGIELWPSFGGSSLDSSTVLYFDKMYLSNEKNVISNDKDYLIPHQTKSGDEDIIDMVKENYPNKQHPRLLFDMDYLDELQTLVETNNFLKKSYQNLIASAEAALVKEVQVYGTPDGKRLLRDAPNMMPVLALAYNLSKDERYATRLWAEVEAAAAFPDWNPSHFLDVGDFARGMAYAYDWMYNYWTEEQRRIARNGIVKNGFTPSMAPLRTLTGFAGQHNNWNQVINAGISLAALAIGDEPGYEALCNEVINRGIESLPIGLESFAPDGACPEGVGYWSYAQLTFYQYNAGMFSAVGTDFGLSEYEGQDKTGYFPILMAGPTNQVFNYADGGTGLVTDPVLFWIARRFNQPELAGYVLESKSGGGNWGDLAMYREDEHHGEYKSLMPNDVTFAGQQPLGVLRSSWFSSDASFVAFKGGDNQASHGDLDIGSFVFDALGIRWFCELGGEYYEAPGMWDFSRGGGRWNYYRKRAEGNNTLVINPKPTEDQNPYATGNIYKFVAGESSSYGLVDMSEAYEEDVTEVKRGFALINNKSTFLLQDEIKTSEPVEIYSMFHTQTAITISDDKKSAILRKNNRRLKVNLLSPSQGELIAMEAKPLPTSPSPEHNNPNTGFSKLAVHLTNASNPTISLLFTPLIEGQSEDISLPNLLPLSQWDSFLQSNLMINSLNVDDIPVDGFSPYSTFYTLNEGLLGEVTAEAESSVQMEITQAKSIGSSAFITLSDKITGQRVTYTLTFDEPVLEKAADLVEYYDIAGVEASAIPEPQNIPENTLDSNLSTRWSAEGKQWIKYDLGKETEFSSIFLAFLSGDVRASIFSIEVSNDGSVWNKVFEGMSSGKTVSPEMFSFNPVTARYIRINGNGNTTNNWNSITLFSVPIPGIRFDDVEGHWAQEYITQMSDVGIISGVTDRMFIPDQKITRAEFFTLVTRVVGSQPEGYTNRFEDVSEGNWFASVLETAYNAKLIPEEMIVEGKILPNAYLTREEMCAIIIKAYELNTIKRINTYGLDRFSDKEQISNWAIPYVDKAISSRFMNGISKDAFGPLENATRAQAATIIRRLVLRM